MGNEGWGRGAGPGRLHRATGGLVSLKSSSSASGVLHQTLVSTCRGEGQTQAGLPQRARRMDSLAISVAQRGAGLSGRNPSWV